MGFFSRFFSDDPGVADAPVIDDNATDSLSEPVLCDFTLTLMETGKF